MSDALTPTLQAEAARAEAAAEAAVEHAAQAEEAAGAALRPVPVAANTPAAPAVSSETTAVAITAPWQITSFDPKVPGWGKISHAPTTGPTASADQVIAAGKSAGILIERR